jgi:hypothetical protein
MSFVYPESINSWPGVRFTSVEIDGNDVEVPYCSALLATSEAERLVLARRT